MTNKIDPIPKILFDEDVTSWYSATDLIIRIAKAFGRSIYQGVYLLDYTMKNILYMSDNLVRLSGGEVWEFKDFMDSPFIKIVHKSELKILHEINAAFLKQLNTFPIEERTEYILSCDFHVIKGHRQHLVNHRLAPIIIDQNGSVRLALCLVSLSSNEKFGNIIMKKIGTDRFFEYTLQDHKWKERKKATLTSNEREVLMLSVQGYTMHEIAVKLYKSIDTIKTYKRSIFSKMDVKNIAEAIIYAQNHRLI